MKILHVSDIHSRKDWHKWILDHAPDFDLICISGDLLDMFNGINHYEQIYELYGWCSKINKLSVPLAICTGNHDFTAKPAPENHAFIKENYEQYSDFYELLTHPDPFMSLLPGVICSDLKNVVFQDKLLITSCPYSFFQARIESDTRKLFYEAHTLKQKHGIPWLVLHHEPPEGTSISLSLGYIDNGNIAFGKWVRNFQPDITLSGHLHEAPFIVQSCVDRIGHTCCFNCGYDQAATIPCHVQIELSDDKILYSWRRNGKMLKKGHLILA